VTSESYHDDPDYLSEPKRRNIGGIFLLCLAIILSGLTVKGVLAANINLNSNQSVEFGQATVQATSCDSQIKFKPESSFTDRLWVVDNGINTHIDGFRITDLQVWDIANSCMGKQFIFNAYSDTSTVPLNYWPLVVNYSSDFGGFFSYDVDSLTVQAFLVPTTIDTNTAGSGSRGGTSEKGSSSFSLLDWASLYSNPGEVDARYIRKITVETQDIPSDSLSNQSGTFSITLGRTLDNREVWTKNLYVKDVGHVNEVLPNSIQSGISFKQAVYLYVPIDATRGVTKTSYNFTGSTNISCADYSPNGSIGWVYVCTPSQKNWSILINYTGI
jgi:hypothetical protein